MTLYLEPNTCPTMFPLVSFFLLRPTHFFRKKLCSLYLWLLTNCSHVGIWVGMVGPSAMAWGLVGWSGVCDALSHLATQQAVAPLGSPLSCWALCEGSQVGQRRPQGLSGFKKFKLKGEALDRRLLPLKLVPDVNLAQ